MRSKTLAICSALFVLFTSAAVLAQQPVNVTRVSGVAPITDPCLDPAKRTVFNINQSAGTSTVEMVSVSGSTRIYLCDGKIQGSAAAEITIMFGSGTTCGSNTANIDTTTITNAGDGALLLPGASGTLARSATGRAICYSRSASTTVEGHIVYVQE